MRVAVCVCEGDRILMVEHTRSHGRHWLVPGGGLEVGETLAECASREMREETGYAVAVERLFLICEAIEPGGRHLLNLFFSGRRTGGRLRSRRNRIGERAAWRTRAELLAMDVHPPIQEQLLLAWESGFEGDLRVLGNVWKPSVILP